MDERELTGLLYRADWTRLALTGTVRGAGVLPRTNFTQPSSMWASGPRPHLFPLPDPPSWMEESAAEPPGAERSLIVAPGRRYRMTSSGGGRVIGCDGERAWQWFADLPPDTEVKFDHQPEPPVPELLAPAWLLLGFRLTVGAETTVAGRPGIAVTGTARTSPLRGLAGTTLWGWGLTGRPERVTAVIDAELGILLRRELFSGDEDADVAEFLSLEVGDPADSSVFTAPEGSFFGDGPGGGRASERRPVDEAGRAALKMVGGLAAGGLGAAVRCRPKRQEDPFAAATAEEPDDAMPDDEPLPGWTADEGADGGALVSDEVLDLLYRAGFDPAPFTATLQEWTDGEVVVGAMLHAVVPESARRAGFGGVGFLVDTILTDEWGASQTTHNVHRVRAGGWDKYRIDRVRRVPPVAAGRLRVRRHDGIDAQTIACDGERTFKVFSDEVRVGPASTLDQGSQGELSQLLDGSWLLTCRLTGGEVVEVDGRAGYRVIATAGTAPVVRPPLSWTPLWWLPAVAVVDASTGRLLRLTRYRDGKVATRLELRSLSDDDGPADFGFTPPEGLPVVDEPERHFSRGPGDDDDGTEFFPFGQPWSPPEDLRAAVGAFKGRVDAAARGFFGSFLGGGDRR